MKRFQPLLVALVVAATARVSLAQETYRTPHRAWLGLIGGMAMQSDGDYGDTILLGGIDAGIQRIAGRTAFSIDLDAYPGSGIYRGRGAVVLGWGFAPSYSTPCIGPPGYSCSNIYTNRKVRSVLGVKLGGEIGTTSDEPYGAIEVGLAVRSQGWADLSVMYDPVDDAMGGAIDLGIQLGRGYGVIEFRGIGGDNALPLVLTLGFGYTPGLK